jgi:protoporphyrin/coproporphyrin ferrochelatase
VGWLNHQTPLIDWTQPNADLAARNLIDLGATAIVFMPIGFATENHETLLDVDHIIHSLSHKHPEVTYVQMECVNDHPEFLAMAAEWAHPQIEALLTEQAIAANSSHETHSHAANNHGHSHGHSHGGHHHHH